MAIDTKKLLPHASKANVVSDKSVENISTIASTLIDVGMGILSSTVS